MPTTDYIVANGMMLGEVTNGVMRNYGTDALGSVVTTYSNGTLENTYAYKPYGATLAKTGTASDPSFLWNGGSGYRAVSLFVVSYYVRARHFSSISAAWTSLDELWPEELAYGYSLNQPVTMSDPTGLAGGTGSGPGTGCCCNVSGVSNQPPTFPGTPWPSLKTKNQQCIKSYGGWNVIYTLNISYSPGSGPGSGSCSASGNEEQLGGTSCSASDLKHINYGVWAGSRTMTDWNTCLTTYPRKSKCKGGGGCKLHDDPGAAPCLFDVLKSAPFAYAVRGAITIYSGCSGPCYKISYDFCEMWDSLPGTSRVVRQNINVTKC